MQGRQRRKSRNQAAVRSQRFEDTMEAFNGEQGQKVAKTIADYHTLLVEPRLAYLESWWWTKLWFRVKQVFRWVFRVKPPEPITPVEEPPDSISYEEMQAAMEGFQKEAERPKA